MYRLLMWFSLSRFSYAEHSRGSALLHREQSEPTDEHEYQTRELGNCSSETTLQLSRFPAHAGAPLGAVSTVQSSALKRIWYEKGVSGRSLPGDAQPMTTKTSPV